MKIMNRFFDERKKRKKAREEGNPLERLTRCYRGVCQLSVIGPRIQLMNASPTACTPLAKTILALPPLYPRMRVIVGALALAVPGPRIGS